jgi:predicted DNA-binding transcriptional regulator AlpA
MGRVMTERLLRTRDVAELLDVSCETVLRWHRRGRLPGGYRLNDSNVLRFEASAAEQWLRNRATALDSEGHSGLHCRNLLPEGDSG